MTNQKILIGLATFVVALLVIRLLWFTHVYAVNMLFFDEWDFFRPLFHNGSSWEAFDYQHGPHRMGIGVLISNALMKVSGWNTRLNSFAVAAAIICSACMGVIVSLKSGGRVWLSILFCGVLFLNLRQYEALIGAVNLSHGAVPELILIAICLCWWVRRVFIRSLCLGFFSWIMIFTGFGLFAGLVVPAILLTQAWVEWREGNRKSLSMHLLTLLIIASGWYLFTRGYVFQPAVDGFHFPHDRPWEYFPFMGLMIGYMVGMPGTGLMTIGAGMVILLIIISSGCFALYKLIRSEGSRPVNQAILTLSTFTVLFCMNVAVGRICLGWEGALASRYLPLMIPGILSIFLTFNQLPIGTLWRERLPLVFLLVISPGMVTLNHKAWEYIHWFHDGKLNWRKAYLETRNEKKANEISNFKIYPAEEVINERMKFLEQHHLNLFKNK